jgi:hypothetical protein
MQNTVRCPSCKAILVVPPVPPEGDFVCPRCRALVPLAATAPPTSSTGPGTAVTDTPPRPAGAEAVRRSEPADSPALPSQYTGASRAASIFVGGAIVLCVAGIAAVKAGKGPPWDKIGPLVVLFGTLAILVVVELAIWLTWIFFPQDLKEAERLTAVGCFVIAVGVLSVAAVVFLVATI